MFPSHGRSLFVGSQTALAECRRAWDLSPKISAIESTEYPQDLTEGGTRKRGKKPDPRSDSKILKFI